MAEIDTTALPEKQSMPDWLNTNDNGDVKGIDTLKLSEAIIKDSPVLGVPFNGSIRYCSYTENPDRFISRA
ncbi:hypothetical protein J3325_06830 [Leuconostoc mesenteroides]|uniref:hypothetical protein n=1 Tax=Leuconostoc mesenteroides TaxID=1245 RepID=UPI001CBC3AA4|nr:hypothetical protein [Leuconostoc mesenteroides]MBZ1527483.1 hypothetical protein [Leuconostoc mesenteroides]